MKIFSKFKDYYDIGLSQGYDDHVTFVRDSEYVPGISSEIFGTPVDYIFRSTKKKHGIYNRSYVVDFKNGIRYQSAIISLYYCGQYYFGIYLKAYKVAWGVAYFPVPDLDRVFWNYDELKSTMADNDYRIDKSGYYFEGEKIPLKEAFSRKITRSETDYLAANHIVIALDSPGSTLIEACDIGSLVPSELPRGSRFLVKNPPLKNIQFFKVKDSYQAYQDIEMYISGTLGVDQVPPVVLSDKERIEKHGMDKWSFRKKGKNSK